MTFSSSRTFPGQAYRRQTLHHAVRDVVDDSADGLGLLLGQIGDEERDVLPAVSQGRHVEGKDVQPVVEIGPEPAGGNRLLEIAVGGRDETNIDRDRLCGAEAFDLAGLQHAKQLHLELFGKLPDFVEEDRAAVRQLETADLAGPSPQ